MENGKKEIYWDKADHGDEESFKIFWVFVTQSVIHRSAASTSSRSLLEMQNLGPLLLDLISLHFIKVTPGIGVLIKIWKPLCYDTQALTMNFKNPASTLYWGTIPRGIFHTTLRKLKLSCVTCLKSYVCKWQKQDVGLFHHWSFPYIPLKEEFYW